MEIGKTKWLVIAAIFLCFIGAIFFVVHDSRDVMVGNDTATVSSTASGTTQQDPPPSIFGASTGSASATTSVLDIAAYNQKMQEIANVPLERVKIAVASGTASSSARATSTYEYEYVRAPSKWPVKAAPYPLAGALLPFNRIVAYYGNFYSTQMGILGEYPPNQVLAMLASTSAMWAAADPSTPVIPAIDYIAVSAQGSPGADGDYRLRMPPSQIEQAISMANQVNGLVFLDIQIGLSTVQAEVPLLAEYLKLPNVELSIDPEFAMHNGERPGTVIGTLDASDINFAADYLANIVTQNNLPPKILVVHRFTQDMVTNYQNITPLPQVQIVMDMDGFGPPAEKFTTYQDFIASEPVQFTGFKLFFKNDIRVPGSHLLTPQEVLSLSPQPSYIQYQ